MLLAAFDHASRGGANGGPRILFPLLLLILIGFVVARIVKRKRGGGGGHHHASSMATLRDRFARGEIDRAEYDHRKAVLNGDEFVPPAPAAPAAPAAAATGWAAPTPPEPPAAMVQDEATEVADDLVPDQVEDEEGDE